MKRVMVFVDGSSFYHGLKNNDCPTYVDFFKLGTHLAGPDRQLQRVYYYNAVCLQSSGEETYRKQQRFLGAVGRQQQVRVKLGRLEPRGDTYVEKGVDIALVVGMLLHAAKDDYDVAILVSGDGDFACALEAVGEMGRGVESAYFQTGRLQHLQHVCDRFHEIDAELIEKCAP